MIHSLGLDRKALKTLGKKGGKKIGYTLLVGVKNPDQRSGLLLKKKPTDDRSAYRLLVGTGPGGLYQAEYLFHPAISGPADRSFSKVDR